MNIIASEYFREPLGEVFSFLDSRARKAAREVCKTWNKVGKLFQDQRIFLLIKSLEKGQLTLLKTITQKNPVNCLLFIQKQLFCATTSHEVRVLEEENGEWKEKQVIDGEFSNVRSIYESKGNLIIEYFSSRETWHKVDGQWVLKEKEKGEFDAELGSSCKVGDYSIYGNYGNSFLAEKDENHSFLLESSKEDEHKAIVNSVVYSKHNAQLFTGSQDGTIKVWGAKAE